MGLNKSIETPFGDTADYWHICLVMNNTKDKVLQVKLYGYATQEARNEMKQPKLAQEFTFSGPSYTSDKSIADLYDLVKKDPMFQGAEDDI